MQPATAYNLLLLRHGESEWNAKNLFTGWVNVPLSAAGRQQAVSAGRSLADSGLLPGFVHTSLQRRAIQTADLALAECDRDWIPVRRSWRLNSNHYGALQGRNKDQVLAQYGRAQFMAWRRGYDHAPPPIPPDDEYSQFSDPRYEVIPAGARPLTESLKDVVTRLLPYWYDAIIPDLRNSTAVLVVSHGNTLRALIRHLDRLTDEQVADLNVPTGSPLLYQLGEQMIPVVPGGSYIGD